MPIYEYRCKKGHNFEVLQRFTDDPVTECEVCGLPVQRVFHPIAVHFKGSGFYNTDYGTRKRSREMKESKEGASASSEGSSGESSSGDSSSSASKDGAGAPKSDSGGSKSESGAKKSESKTSKASSGND
jgi:putative FmdB family regulatory protein